MLDFDANEEPIRLTGAGRSDPLDPAEIGPPSVRRARDLAYGHLKAKQGRPGRRVGTGVALLARRRRATRRACPYGRRVSVLGTPPRHRRRLWTMCHGRAPGSPS
jgi:hypothetical protein